MFYDRFYELCQKKGVTPAKVSRDVGIGQSTIAMWKIQGTTPNAKTVAALARYFDVSQYYLLTGKTTVNMGGFKNPSSDDSEFTDENAEKQLAKLHQYGEMAKELDRMNGHFEYSEEQIKKRLSQMTVDELLDLLGMVTEEVKKQTNGEESK